MTLPECPGVAFMAGPFAGARSCAATEIARGSARATTASSFAEMFAIFIVVALLFRRRWGSGSCAGLRGVRKESRDRKGTGHRRSGRQMELPGGAARAGQRGQLQIAHVDNSREAPHTREEV